MGCTAVSNDDGSVSINTPICTRVWPVVIALLYMYLLQIAIEAIGLIPTQVCFLIILLWYISQLYFDGKELWINGRVRVHEDSVVSTLKL